MLVNNTLLIHCKLLNIRTVLSNSGVLGEHPLGAPQHHDSAPQGCYTGAFMWAPLKVLSQHPNFNSAEAWVLVKTSLLCPSLIKIWTPLSFVTTVHQVHCDTIFCSVMHFMYVSVYFDIDILKICVFWNNYCVPWGKCVLKIPFLWLSNLLLRNNE